MNLTNIENNTKSFILNQIGDFRANIAVVLGSGLSDLVTDLDQASFISYSDVPGLDLPNVAGHSASFAYGSLHGVNVLFLQGRPHWYQGVDASVFHVLMHVVKAFGCEEILMTNAAGAIDPNFAVGSIVSIFDHINFQGKNPLLGLTQNNNCFVGLENCYDSAFRQRIKVIANKNKIKLHDGVYLGTLGPCFETPAEIKMFANCGAHVIGMSTIPEVLTARYYGIKVAVLSLISNRAAGCGDEDLSHELTLSRVKMAGGNMRSLVNHFIASHNISNTREHHD